MLKHIFYILTLAILFISCREINIDQEVNNTQLLDSVLHDQKKRLDNMDSVKINSYLRKAKERIRLFENPSLNDFQKQWLQNDKLAYLKIYNNLQSFNKQIDSLHSELKYSKSQILTLKQDLIYRNLNKAQFNSYFSEEQKALAKLNALTEKIDASFNESITHFNVLEFKLQGILNQLDALQSNYDEPTKQ